VYLSGMQPRDRQVDDLAGLDVLAQGTAAPGREDARWFVGAKSNLDFRLLGVIEEVCILDLIAGMARLEPVCRSADDLDCPRHRLKVPDGDCFRLLDACGHRQRSQRRCASQKHAQIFRIDRRRGPLPGPFAVTVYFNDVSAAGALVALREAGRKVPEDISVIGFDDISLASQLYPTLSTVREPLPQMARAAVNMLLAMIVGLEAPSQRITLPAQLITRQSTAGARTSESRSKGEGGA